MAQDNLVSKAVVIGGSAGSLDVALGIVSQLSPNSNAVYVIVLHRKADGESLLAKLFSSRTSLPVKEVEDKETIRPNSIYIAPADYHLLFEDMQTFALDSSEKVHHSRPSIDVTLESVAQVFTARSIGVLLSGANADGAEGLQTIKAAGGIAIVQDPESAGVSFMPQQAIQLGAVDAIAPPDQIGHILQSHI